MKEREWRRGSEKGEEGARKEGERERERMKIFSLLVHSPDSLNSWSLEFHPGLVCGSIFCCFSRHANRLWLGSGTGRAQSGFHMGVDDADGSLTWCATIPPPSTSLQVIQLRVGVRIAHWWPMTFEIPHCEGTVTLLHKMTVSKVPGSNGFRWHLNPYHSSPYQVSGLINSYQTAANHIVPNK